MIKLDSALGVEIRDGRLLFSLVSRRLHDFVLERFFIVEDFKSLTPVELKNSLQAHFRDTGFNRENVIIGLPREEVILRRVELPLEVEENLSEVVKFQVEKFEPAEEDRSCFDYAVLERDEKAKRISLQIHMVRRRLVDEYLNLFDQIELFPAAVRLSTLGVHQLFLRHDQGFPEGDPSLVLLVESETAELIAVRGRSQCYSERVRSRHGEWTVEHLVTEIDGFFSRARMRADNISRLFLHGPATRSLLAGFQARFSDCESLVTRLHLRTEGITGSQLLEAGPSAGLALSALKRTAPLRLNLIPAEKRRVQERPSLIPTFVLLGLLLLMGGALGTRDFLQQQSMLAKVDAQIQAMQPQVDRVLILRGQIEARESELLELSEMMRGRQRAIAVLRDLTERIPDDSYLNHVQIVQDRVTIQGYSDSASTLLQYLRNSELLDNPVSKFINRDQRVGKDRFNFEATIRDKHGEASRE